MLSNNNFILNKLFLAPFFIYVQSIDHKLFSIFSGFHRDKVLVRTFDENGDPKVEMVRRTEQSFTLGSSFLVRIKFYWVEARKLADLVMDPKTYLLYV